SIVRPIRRNLVTEQCKPCTNSVNVTSCPFWIKRRLGFSATRFKSRLKSRMYMILTMLATVTLHFLFFLGLSSSVPLLRFILVQKAKLKNPSLKTTRENHSIQSWGYRYWISPVWIQNYTEIHRVE